MSQHQDFDEDRILAKLSKRKSKKPRDKRVSQIKSMKNRICNLVHDSFNFDNSIEYNITIDELRELSKGVFEYVSEDTPLTLRNVKAYMGEKLGGESKITNFDNYCMEMFNILCNNELKFVVADVIYYEECPVCFECKDDFVSLRCNHIFCWNCVESIYEKSNDLFCPFCRDGTTPELVINRASFIKPLPIDELHNLINIVINFYVARELGYAIDHIKTQCTDRIISGIKFPTEENNLISEYHSRFSSELEDSDPLDVFWKTK